MKFIVDSNVGRLAVWLRVLGYDAVFINPIEDSELVEIARRENRIILTKDTGIMQRRVVTSGQLKALLIEGKDWRHQLGQVIRTLKLQTHLRFTRCLRCNAPLESRTREEAKPYVPASIYRMYTSFFYCPSCQRHYWQGSHWNRMNRAMESISKPSAG